VVVFATMITLIHTYYGYTATGGRRRGPAVGQGDPHEHRLDRHRNLLLSSSSGRHQPVSLTG